MIRAGIRCRFPWLPSLNCSCWKSYLDAGKNILAWKFNMSLCSQRGLESKSALARSQRLVLLGVCLERCVIGAKT